MFEIIRKYKNISRKELLLELDKTEKVYIPQFTEYDEKTRKVTKNGEGFEIKKISAPLENCVATPILTEDSYFSNTHIIELVRGCPQRCGFCLASYLNCRGH